MSRLKQFLNRFTGGVDVRFIQEADVPACTDMALASLQEHKTITGPDTCKSIRTWFAGVASRDVPVAAFVAVRKGFVLGMVCCSMVQPDLWDSRPTMSVWWLYVLPECRKSPKVVNALLRACRAFADTYGAQKCKITVDDEHKGLINRYEKSFGFVKEQSLNIYSMELEG
jgi:ribosomal protein S18 acetylase RimI-like enzyme